MSLFKVMKVFGRLACVLALVGCASTAPPPLALPKGQAVRLVARGGADLRVLMPTAGGGTGGARMLDDAVAAANRDSSARFKEEMERQQMGGSLAELFLAETRKRIVAKGGRLAADGEDGSAPAVTLENLTVMYYAPAVVAAYRPTAFVYVSASTDPPTVGNKPGAAVRSLEVSLAQQGFAFPSSGAVFADPKKAYAGARAAVVALAERVATEVVGAAAP